MPREVELTEIKSNKNKKSYDTDIINLDKFDKYIQKQEKLNQQKKELKLRREKDIGKRLLQGLSLLTSAKYYGNNIKTDISYINIASATLLSESEQKSKKIQPWYTKIGNLISGAINNLVSLTSSNWTSFALIGVFLGTGIATSATLPIVLAGTFLTTKIVSTIIDVKKAIQIRKFNKENNALIDYATQKNIQKTLCDISPKLQNIKKDNALSKEKKEELHLGKGVERAEKVIQLVNAITVIVGAVLANPTAAVVVGAKATGIVAKDKIVEEILRTKETRQSLVELINEKRKSGEVNYQDINELREHTHKMKIDNLAMKNTLKQSVKDGFKFSSNEFEEQREKAKKELGEFKEENKTNTQIVVQGVKDVFNPFNETKIKEHSGATKYEESSGKIENDNPKTKHARLHDVAKNYDLAIANKATNSQVLKGDIDKNSNPLSENISEKDTATSSSKGSENIVSLRNIKEDLNNIKYDVEAQKNDNKRRSSSANSKKKLPSRGIH